MYLWNYSSWHCKLKTFETKYILNAVEIPHPNKIQNSSHEPLWIPETQQNIMCIIPSGERQHFWKYFPSTSMTKLWFRIYKNMGLYRCWLCTTQRWNLVVICFSLAYHVWYHMCNLVAVQGSFCTVDHLSGLWTWPSLWRGQMKWLSCIHFHQILQPKLERNIGNVV